MGRPTALRSAKGCRELLAEYEARGGRSEDCDMIRRRLAALEIQAERRKSRRDLEDAATRFLKTN